MIKWKEGSALTNNLQPTICFKTMTGRNKIVTDKNKRLRATDQRMIHVQLLADGRLAYRVIRIEKAEKKPFS